MMSNAILPYNAHLCCVVMIRHKTLPIIYWGYSYFCEDKLSSVFIWSLSLSYRQKVEKSMKKIPYYASMDQTINVNSSFVHNHCVFTSLKNLSIISIHPTGILIQLSYTKYVLFHLSIKVPTVRVSAPWATAVSKTSFCTKHRYA